MRSVVRVYPGPPKRNGAGSVSDRFEGLLKSAQAFDAVVRGSRNGAVAQLGERLICIQEVAGSIPTSSTSFFQIAANISRNPRGFS